ncbi:hypothetical protein OTU49_004798, partial [Cherax quadricarinatus]
QTTPNHSQDSPSPTSHHLTDSTTSTMANTQDLFNPTDSSDYSLSTSPGMAPVHSPLQHIIQKILQENYVLKLQNENYEKRITDLECSLVTHNSRIIELEAKLT